MDFVRIFCWPPCSSWRQEGKLPSGKLTYQWNIPPCLIGNTPSKGPCSIANVVVYRSGFFLKCLKFFAPAFLGGNFRLPPKKAAVQGSATTYGSLSLVTSKEMTWRASSRRGWLAGARPIKPTRPNNRRNPQTAPSFGPHRKLTCQGGWVGSLIRLFSAFDRNGVCLCGGRTSFFLDRSYSSKTWSRRWFYKGRLPDNSSRTGVMFQPCFKEKTRYLKKTVWNIQCQRPELKPKWCLRLLVTTQWFNTKSQRWPSPTEFHLSSQQHQHHPQTSFFGVVKCVLKNNLFVGNQPFVCIQNFSNYPTTPHNNTTSLTAGGLPEIHLRKYTKKEGAQPPVWNLKSLQTLYQDTKLYGAHCRLWSCLSCPTDEADRYSRIWGEKSHLKNHFSSLGNPTFCLSLSSLWIQQKTTGCLLYRHDACHVCNQSNQLQQRDSTNLPLPVLVKAFSWYLDP